MSTSASPWEVSHKHLGLLEESLRAPSAHNAQPWEIRVTGNNEYELHYIQTEDLPLDHDDKDAYLTMGALTETISLQAPNHGLVATIEPTLTKDGQDLFIARVELDQATGTEIRDPLSDFINRRTTNRKKYQRTPLPVELEDQLHKLGNVVLESQLLKEVIKDATVKSWADRRFVSDLKDWFRENDDAEDGITPGPFEISNSDILGLKLAFMLGRIRSRTIGELYASKDVSYFTSAPRAAVIHVNELTPPAMFDAGRRLLRSWVTVASHGFSTQPYSVAVDERSTVPRVATITGTKYPVALYRIGLPKDVPSAVSNRKPLSKVLS